MSFKVLPGGEAFPSHPEADVERHYIAQGMSLRDYFAAKAMQGFIASTTDDSNINKNRCAKWTYEMADAMLEARK